MCYHWNMNNQEKELTKWAKTRIAPEDYKVLKKLAVDKEVTLAELLRQALRTLIKEKE